jgi:CheY-like chemotaxis protein
MLTISTVNSDEQQPSRPAQSVPKEDVSKAASELNNLLQIISGTSSEIANICEGETSAHYVSMLQKSIRRAETVAAHLTQQAGGTDQKLAMHPDLAGFAKQKKVAEIPVAKPQILVVDDEEVALILVKQLLVPAGYQVTTAQSGFECLDLFRRRPLAYELILLDLTMPFMDGEETFHRLREIRPDVTVMLCTGFIQNDRLEQLMRQGLAGFLRKPFAPDEIATQVKAILESVKYSRASGVGADSSLAG